MGLFEYGRVFGAVARRPTSAGSFSPVAVLLSESCVLDINRNAFLLFVVAGTNSMPCWLDYCLHAASKCWCLPNECRLSVSSLLMYLKDLIWFKASPHVQMPGGVRASPIEPQQTEATIS